MSHEGKLLLSERAALDLFNFPKVCFIFYKKTVDFQFNSQKHLIYRFYKCIV